MSLSEHCLIIEAEEDVHSYEDGSQGGVQLGLERKLFLSLQSRDRVPQTSSTFAERPMLVTNVTDDALRNSSICQMFEPHAQPTGALLNELRINWNLFLKYQFNSINQ